MSLKQEAETRLAALMKRLDAFNCSLAEQALPASRRSKVSELALQDKALKAGQKSPPKKG